MQSKPKYSKSSRWKVLRVLQWYSMDETGNISGLQEGTTMGLATAAVMGHDVYNATVIDTIRRIVPRGTKDRGLRRMCTLAEKKNVFYMLFAVSSV